MLGNTRNTIMPTGVFSKFNNNRYVSGTKEFLSSNSVIAKMVFVFFVLIVSLFVFRLGVSLIKWWYSDPYSVTLIDGTISGNTQGIISQDPKDGIDKIIIRSKNEKDGLEFTWSTWLFIEKLRTDGKMQHIFHKGSKHMNDKNMNYPLVAPGLYLDATNAPNSTEGTFKNNNLIIAMNTTSDSDNGEIIEKIKVENVPLKKWIHVVIRMRGRNLDVYINGSIVKRATFNGVPRQNYGHVYTNMKGGFDGKMSNLKYFRYALSVQEIMRLNSSGPNMKLDKSLYIFPPYFNYKWYTDTQTTL